jgi:hypothetical protein
METEVDQVELVAAFEANLARTFCPRIAQFGRAFGQSARLVQAPRAMAQIFKQARKIDFLPGMMVGATGIEPVTPTMSR